MDDTTSRVPLDEFEPESTLSLNRYRPFIGKKKEEELKRLAEPLEGVGWANVNSTFMGGGVAEMLRSVVPLARSLGIRASWYTIRGHNDFFQVTKKFHNMLQGVDCSITLEEIFGAYLDTIDENAKNTYIASDMVVVHDPQPAALVMNGVIFGNVLWRCHIDTSAPNMSIWRFLLPYINHCAGAIFTMPEFLGPGLQIPIYQITPCIDPLAEKNRIYNKDDALEILGPLFDEHNVDPERPILAAVSRYDIHKNQATILKAFNQLRDKREFRKPPYLIFLGNTATDDPEGDAMLIQLKDQAGDDPDIRFFVNVEDNDRVVGALMHIAQGFIHVSTREGFGLVVAEALWQGTPVIGSKVGGIVEQVVGGKTGFLVDAMHADAITKNMGHLLDHPDEAAAMGQKGHEHVRDNFLLPELVRRYLVLLRFYTGIDRELPAFR
ncbi:MAG: glycosyltransferase, partial [Planctomycetota bacterium]